ncbi:MAG: hypothetical protein WC838_02685 [Candidatus Margulisiibacteriota bacterium]|jgi:hypothetical protein
MPSKLTSGFGLILVIIVSFILLSTLTSLLYLSINRYQIAQMEKLRVQSLILAESGLAKGLWQVKYQTNFHTDPSYAGTTANLKTWLIRTAVGQTEPLNNGYFKLIKETGRNRLFVIGFLGASPEANKAMRIIQQDYVPSMNSLSKTRWQEVF